MKDETRSHFAYNLKVPFQKWYSIEIVYDIQNVDTGLSNNILVHFDLCYIVNAIDYSFIKERSPHQISNNLRTKSSGPEMISSHCQQIFDCAAVNNTAIFFAFLPQILPLILLSYLGFRVLFV